VDDLVDGLIKLMMTPGDLGPVNFGSDVDIPLLEVAQRIIEMTGSRSQVVFKPALLFLTQLGLPSLVKAKEKLGWIPLMTLENGLKRTIAYTMANKSLLSFQTFA
jgi:UDP-glucuronate decarboxylase